MIAESDKVQVLVVDDYPETLQAIRAVLEAPDRTIVTAASGEEALRYLLDGEYAVILLDVKMSGMDGYDTAALIRAREKTRATPIIFLTSNNKEAEHVIHGYSQGAVDYLFKPLVPEILQSKVSVFVELAKHVLALARRNRELERTKKELAEHAAELARSNAALEQFAYVASHDLKEPLRMVSSYVKLLATRYKDRLDQDANDFIDFAVQGVSRMERLIQDVLAYSRAGSKRDFQILDAASLLGSAIARLQAAIIESDATITQDPLPTVLGHEADLVRVFQNLVGNAIKFRGERPPAVHLSAERRRSGAGQDEWVISVRDNGIGIAPEYWERIFILFQRLHGRGEYEGSGVGLALCKKIIESHHGRIWVDSQIGAGSTFSFALPIAPTA